MNSMESDLILSKKAAELIRENFPKNEITNLLVVRYGKKWKNKLGHIKPIKKNPEFGTLIELNEIFKCPEVPEWIVDLTLMHELVHYFQGFGSNIPKERIFPHRGSCVDKELKKFGYTELLKKQKKWLKENWLDIYKEHCPNKKKYRRKRNPVEKIISMVFR